MSIFENSIKDVDMNIRKIFFNEDEHAYTDDLNNKYVSVTQLIGRYKEPFDTKGMAKAVRRKRTSQYYGWSVTKIIKHWDYLRDKACLKGNKKHNFMETAIKKATGYKTYVNSVTGKVYIKDRLYTIDNIIKKHNYGEVQLAYFIKLGVKDRFPGIFDIIVDIKNKGYKLYAEIGVYNYKYLISGLIDLLCVKGNDFAIIDWKTNIDKLRYDSGYYKKDIEGNRTDEWVANNQYLRYPLHFLQQSHGNEYSLQLSLYAYLVEQFGFTCKSIILCHIRDVEDKEIVEFYPIEYMKDNVKAMVKDYYKDKQKALNKQGVLQLTF